MALVAICKIRRGFIDGFVPQVPEIHLIDGDHTAVIGAYGGGGAYILDADDRHLLIAANNRGFKGGYIIVNGYGPQRCAAAFDSLSLTKNKNQPEVRAERLSLPGLDFTRWECRLSCELQNSAYIKDLHGVSVKLYALWGSSCFILTLTSPHRPKRANCASYCFRSNSYQIL